MKKNLFICFLLIFSVTFSASEKIVLVDYSYILDNYYKTKAFNKTLDKLRDTLEEKYNFSFSDENIDENNKKALETYKKYKNEFTNEITRDIEIAVVFTGQTENYDLILEKSAVKYGKGKDISKYILNFLNDAYCNDFTIEDSKRFISDIFLF